jgi:hypothetical protein
VGIVYKNNAKTTLASDILSTDTSISVTDGSVFPSLGAGDYFLVTFDDGTNNEIVKCTAVSTNTLTVTRAQESTTARAFSSGDAAENRVTAGTLDTITTLSVEDLSDTNITSPADASVLFYDTATSKWIDNVVSGDISIADTGVAAIGSGVIVNDDINASAAISVSKTALVDGTGLTLTGDTLSVDASQTQITAVGTIATGTWQGTAIADAYVADDLTISGGTVDNSVIGGSTPAAGTFTTLTANTSITGTLATAAQPNVTSVGTLTSLTVSGDVTVDTNTLYVDSTANSVGIGTVSPGEALEVVGNVEASGEFIGGLRGAVVLKAKAGEAITKGEAVYISGISGGVTVVSRADANVSSKMPAVGVASETVSLNASITIYTFGSLGNIDTSAYSEGDELFVDTNPGALSTTAPTGESAALQKIAKVTRSDASVGSITIMGAGRSNAVPNLNDGNIFIGNASNQAVSAALGTKVEEYLDTGTSTPTFASATVTGDLTVDTSTLKVDSTNNRVGILNATPDVSLDIGSATDAIHVPTGTTAQRPTAEAGFFRYNSETGQFEGYTTEWGAIAGGGGGSNTFTTDTFTGDGSTTAFTLSQSISDENDLVVFNGGVFQNQSAYSVSGTTLTFDTAPANGNTVVVYSVASAVSGNNLNLDQFTGDGSTTGFTLSINPVNENNTQVFIDGVYQQKDGYTTSGTTLTFDTAPPNTATIEVMTFTQTDINTATILKDADEDTKVQVEESADEDIIRFDTAGTERMVINSTGNVLVGTTSVGYSGVDLTVGDTTDSQNGVAIQTSTTGYGYLLFGDGSGADAYRGQIYYKHGDDFLGVHTAGAERMRINSSGNLLVGKTDTTLSVAGVFIGASGSIGVTRASDDCLTLNRTGTDGAIITFYNDGTTVGSINAGGGNVLAIGQGSNYIQFHDSLNNFYASDGSTGRDNAMDIGASGVRFKDLYLSGGAYLGGTGSANKLDDYEEGTWTPDLRRNDGTVSATFTVANASYVKIGAIVHVKAFIYNISAGSSNGSQYWRLNGMPFASDVEQYSAIALPYNTTSANTIYVGDAAGNGIFTIDGTPYTGSLTGGFMFTMTYRAS